MTFDEMQLILYQVVISPKSRCFFLSVQTKIVDS